MQTSQGPPPPYPNAQANNNNGASNKRFKTGTEEIAQSQQQNARTAQPPFYLNTQQLQMLQYLQQNQNNLTTQQQNVLQQLTQQYRLMQQHQQQVRLQQQQRAVQPQQQVGQQQQQPNQRPPQAGVISTQQQQFLNQQQQSSGFQQSSIPRVPQSGTIAQTGFSVDSTGNFTPAATGGHIIHTAGMPYKSAAGTGFQPQQQQFNTNLGYTQISSTTNQSDMGIVKCSLLPFGWFELSFFF